jgi:hypothetical protein
MSALGQKRTLGDVRLMSALPPKADIVSATSSLLFDWRVECPCQFQWAVHLAVATDRRVVADAAALIFGEILVQFRTGLRARMSANTIAIRRVSSQVRIFP